MRLPTTSALFVIPFLGSCVTAAALEPYRRFAPRADGIQWGSCDGTDDKNIACGTFEVPLDWADESKGKAQLAVAKYASTKEPRKGTLFTNPGGPGGSGVDLIMSSGSDISNLSGGYYDVLSWDPRGVGKTKPGVINCFNSSDEYISFWNGTMVYPPMEVRGAFELQSDLDNLYSQITPMEERWKALGDACLKQDSGQYMQYVGTTAAVRDMVAMAEALEGNGTLINYWGYSYGTSIGAYFLGMFPQRVGRVILDGIQDPVIHALSPANLGWARTVTSAGDAFLAMAERCAKAGPKNCKISTENSTGLGITQWMYSLLDVVYDYGKKSGNANFSASGLRSSVHNALYNPESLPDFVNEKLWGVYEQTSNASGTTVPLAPRALPPSPMLVRRDGDEQSWPNYLMNAVICGDSIDDQTTTKEVFDEIVRVVKDVSPMFGQQFPQPVHYCHKWPFRAVERFRGPFNASLNNKVLLITTQWDPTTPRADAQRVQQEMGDNAVMVIQNGLGHLSSSQQSNCTHTAILNYLTEGTLPSNGTVCQIDFGKELFSNSTNSTNSAADGHKNAASLNVDASNKWIIGALAFFFLLSLL